jgi:hypothetical protein
LLIHDILPFLEVCAVCKHCAAAGVQQAPLFAGLKTKLRPGRGRQTKAPPRRCETVEAAQRDIENASFSLRACNGYGVKAEIRNQRFRETLLGVLLGLVL